MKRAAKKPSIPPAPASRPGSVRSKPSAVGAIGAGNSSGPIGAGFSLSSFDKAKALFSPSSRSIEQTA